MIAPANVGGSTGAPENGWKFLVPWGNFTHPLGLQRVSQSSGQRMAAALATGVRRILGKIGLGNAARPIYYGHPDDPAFADRFEDTAEYGHVEELEARADGLWARITWTAAANALFEQGQKLYFSPRWVARWISEDVLEPERLISIGLYSRPNIPSAGAANTKLTDDMTEREKRLLQLFGYSEKQITALANGDQGAPADTAVYETAQDHINRAALANGMWDAIGALLKAAGFTDEEITKLDRDEFGQPEVDDLVARFKAKFGGEGGSSPAPEAPANAKLDALTRMFASREVDVAIANGQVRPADRETEIAALANAADMSATVSALHQRPKVLPTQGRDFATRKQAPAAVANAAEASRKLESIANAIVRDEDVDPHMAWSLAEERNPDLTKQAYGRTE